MNIHSRSRLLLTTIACCLAASSYVQAAQSTVKTRLSVDPRDFQGMWQGPMADHGFAAGFTGPPPTSGDGNGPSAGPSIGLSSSGGLLGELSSALKPEAAARIQRTQELTLKGTAPMNWHVACRPGPAQNLMSDDLGGFEIVQNPTRVLFLFDTDNTYWEVYLDREHPKNPKPSYLGHSVGHWEGNTLVIDTIGYNGRGSIIMGALPSTQVHTITRIWKEQGGKQLKYETYMEDPVNFTRPGKLPTAVVNLTPDHRIYEEHCTQSERTESVADMLFEDFTREEAFPYFYKK